jgi:hypothetical protein
VALTIIVIHLIGDAPSTFLIGWIADHSNLLWAMRAAVLAQVVGGVLFFFVIYLIHSQGLHHESLAAYRIPEIAALEGLGVATEGGE